MSIIITGSGTSLDLDTHCDDVVFDTDTNEYEFWDTFAEKCSNVLEISIDRANAIIETINESEMCVNDVRKRL